MSSMALDRVKDFASASPVMASLAGVLVIASLMWHFLKRPQKLNLPIIETIPGNRGHDQAIQEGFSKYPDTPFILQTTPPLVILPMSLVDEVKSLPENKASMMEEIRRAFSSDVTGFGIDTHETIPAVKNDLTRHLTSVLDGLQDETRFSLDKEFGPCEDWTSQKVYQKLTNIVALLSGRVFVGRPLSRDEEWLDSTINYTMTSVKAKNACEKYPPFIRPIVGPFLKEVQDLQKHKKRGGEMLRPLLEDILKRQEMGLEKREVEAYEDEQGTFCSWMLKYADPNVRMTPLRLANNQMGLSFAAIHTTSMALSQIIFDLAARPEYIKVLREEIREIIAEDGQEVDIDGHVKLKKTSFTKLKKLDSFVKESQRLSPPSIVSMNRVIMSPLTLSTGLTLPTGTRIAFPSLAIHRSASTPAFAPAHNPSGYTDPAHFDGLRFAKLRAMPGKAARHQYVTTAPDSMVFGHGAHACPGRFFASNEIKVALVELLRAWDMRMPGDVDGTGAQRYKNLVSDMSCLPDPRAEVEFRRLKREVAI